MKRTSSIKRSVLLTLAASLSASLTASAAVVTAPVTGDIFLGFRATGATGGSTSYLVKIGVDTTFRTAIPGSTFTISGLGNIGADLIATYGSNWNSRADVQWGIFGTRAEGFVANYASLPQSSAGLPLTPFNTQDQGQRSEVSGEINNVLVQPNGYIGRESTINSTVAVLQPNSSSPVSYAQQVGGGGPDFGGQSGWSSIDGNFGLGTAGTSLDFYRFSGTNSTNSSALLGNFRISDTGALSFTAVPEPGSAGLALLAGGLALATRRRRTAVTA